MIRFRAWHPIDGMATFSLKTLVENDGKIIFEKTGAERYPWCVKDPINTNTDLKIMMISHLYDCDNYPIYEQDIVQTVRRNRHELWQVIYERARWLLRSYPSNNVTISLHDAIQLDGVSILTNIYEAGY